MHGCIKLGTLPSGLSATAESSLCLASGRGVRREQQVFGRRGAHVSRPPAPPLSAPASGSAPPREAVGDQDLELHGPCPQPA